MTDNQFNSEKEFKLDMLAQKMRTLIYCYNNNLFFIIKSILNVNRNKLFQIVENMSRHCVI